MADIKSVVLTASNAGHCFDAEGNFNLSKKVVSGNTEGTNCQAMLAQYTNIDHTLKINQLDANCTVTSSKMITGLKIPEVSNIYDETGTVIANVVIATFDRTEDAAPGLGVLDDLFTGDVQLDLSVDGMLGICLEPLPMLSIV